MDEEHVLWHGSPKRINGEFLLPMRARDVGGKAENSHNGIYALRKREFAVVMAILKSDGVKGSVLDFGTKVPEGIVIEGWPNQERVYLYKLPARTFHNVGWYQWVSSSMVKPLEITEIKVRDFVHLIRPATEKENEAFSRIQSEDQKKRRMSR